MYLVFGLSKGEWNLAIDLLRAKVHIGFPIIASGRALERVFARFWGRKTFSGAGFGLYSSLCIKAETEYFTGTEVAGRSGATWCTGWFRVAVAGGSRDGIGGAGGLEEATYESAGRESGHLE
jgi:hypothetical protein